MWHAMFIEQIPFAEKILRTSSCTLLSLKRSERGATKADVASLRDQLSRIETLLRATP